MTAKSIFSAAFFVSALCIPYSVSGQQTTSPINQQTTASANAPVSAAAAVTTPTATPALPPLRLNYDRVAPDEDATSQPLGEVTALNEDRQRAERLAAAAIADNYRETSTQFVFYRNLAPGNSSEGDAGRAFVSTQKAYPGRFGRQPAGPLSGRVIYCSAGHGWTNDNTSTTLWYTQRPDTHGVVEDFGNLDQMNLYADICFRAGATIVPLRPIGFQHVERIIDNESQHAGFHGRWADSQSTASFGFAGSNVPYRFARVAAEETAVARFRPVLPVTDIYPVYAWARAGADRVIQTYRIVSASGVTEVDVDHRKVGNGWVYLGSYFFREGTSGYVEITNKSRDAAAVADQGVVIADAIRFGNGMGDVNRGGGISGFPREEEASRYWVERALPAGAPPIFNAFEDRSDQSNNVGAAPRFAAYMNRENMGGFFDRVFMSFHSNAVGGRGVMGLYNSHAQLRPDHQIELAKLTADELNKEMTSAGLNLARPWAVRRMLTQAHINFGEIRRDYLNNEMSATILEVAFHDNPDDAALLRQLSVRRAAALSAYRATLRFLSEVGEQDVAILSPPHAPRLLSVTPAATTGSVVVRWEPAAQDPLSSQTEDITYRLYTSADGVAFGTSQDVGNTTQFELNDQDIRRPLYVRVTAISPGGESLPSQVMGISISPESPVLIIHAAGTETDDLALTQTAQGNLGAALRPGGEFARLIPHLMNSGEQVRAVGTGLRTLAAGFETLDVSQISSVSDFNRYRAVAVLLGRQPVAEAMTTTPVLTALHDYVTTGGRLLITGGNLAEVDTASSESLARWGDFVQEVLQVSFADQTSVTELLKAGGRELTTVTLRLGDRKLRYFEPRPTEVLVPNENGRAVLAYEGAGGAAAVATLKDGTICTAVMGFPLEELDDRDEQAVLAAQFFLAMGLKSPAPPSRPGRRPRGDEMDVGTTTGTVAGEPASVQTTTTETATTTPVVTPPPARAAQTTLSVAQTTASVSETTRPE